MTADPTASARRLPRSQRREQILAAATTTFARAGFADTTMDDIASAAGISRVILYRHFESKDDIYRSALARVDERIATAVASVGDAAGTVTALVTAAAADPDGFRLLFRHAAREPRFRSFTDRLARQAETAAHQQVAHRIREPVWARWTARLAPMLAIEAVMAWLDLGQPDPEQVVERVERALAGLVPVPER